MFFFNVWVYMSIFAGTLVNLRKLCVVGVTQLGQLHSLELGRAAVGLATTLSVVHLIRVWRPPVQGRRRLDVRHVQVDHGVFFQIRPGHDGNNQSARRRTEKKCQVIYISFYVQTLTYYRDYRDGVAVICGNTLGPWLFNLMVLPIIVEYFICVIIYNTIVISPPPRDQL